MKVTITQDDGSAQDFFPQSYTDAAVAAAVANVQHPKVQEVDVKMTDGSEVTATPNA